MIIMMMTIFMRKDKRGIGRKNKRRKEGYFDRKEGEERRTGKGKKNKIK